MSGPVLELPWLVFGGRLVFDALSVPVLAATTVAWGLAGWAFVRSSPGLGRGGRIAGSFVLTAAASLVATVAGDAITFFLAYSVMGLAAYPLVAARGTRRALRTARWYLALMLLGEGALLAALLLSGPGGVSGPVPFPRLAGPGMAVLVLVGLGVKSGVPGLHSWMPAAYSVTPNPAAAALAGGTISVGILGFVRLGVGGGAPGMSAEAWLGVGAAGMIFGVVRGLLNREPERILAYSSVSQMGMALGLLGFAARSGADEAAVSAAVGLFLFHHALAKTSLFLGVGAVREGAMSRGRGRPLVILAMLALPALALAGLPFTSGAVAKGALAEAIPTEGLDAFLLAASAGTTALMLHFLAGVRAMARARAAPAIPRRPDPWTASAVVVAVGVWPWPGFRVAVEHALHPDAVLHALPGLVAGGLAWALARMAGWKGTRRTSVGERMARAVTVRWDAWSARRQEVRPRLRHVPAEVRREARHAVIAVERVVGLLDSRVGTWTLTGTLFLVVLLVVRLVV